MNNEIKVVLFDLGRVLMHIDFDAFPNGLGLYTEEQRAPYKIGTAKLWHVYETGKLTTEEFLDALFIIFNGKFSKGKIFDAWNCIIVKDNDEIVPLVHKIQQQYRTAILSNTSPSHWEKVLRISSIVRLIPHHFTSFNIGAMKPERIVYEYVAKSLNVLSNEILFIDDLPGNVEGAISAGMRGIVYKHVSDLEKYIFSH